MAQSWARLSIALSLASIGFMSFLLWKAVLYMPDVHYFTGVPLPPSPPPPQPSAASAAASATAAGAAAIAPPQGPSLDLWSGVPEHHMPAAILRPPLIPHAWVVAAREEREEAEARRLCFLPWNAAKLAWWWWRKKKKSGPLRGETALKVEWAECPKTTGDFVAEMDAVQSGNTLLRAIAARDGLSCSLFRTRGSIARHIAGAGLNGGQMRLIAKEFNWIAVKRLNCPDAVLPELFVEKDGPVEELVFEMLCSLAAQGELRIESYASLDNPGRARDALKAALEPLTKAVMPLVIIRLTRLSWQHLFLKAAWPHDVAQLSWEGTASSRLIGGGHLHSIYKLADWIADTLPGNVDDPNYHKGVAASLRDAFNRYVRKNIGIPGRNVLQRCYWAIKTVLDPAQKAPRAMQDFLF